MLNLERIINHERLLQATTGLNRQAFEELLPSFNDAYEQSQSKPGMQRKRARGGGRKATLRPIEDKLRHYWCGNCTV